MKITKLTTYMVPPRWLFLKIDTDEGISGEGHRWRNPVWRHADGSFAEW